jgi:hypothetical protein
MWGHSRPSESPRQFHHVNEILDPSGSVSTSRRAKSRTGSSVANRVRAGIVQCDACRILTWLLTNCDTSNYPCAAKKLQAAFDDENSGFPFLNPETRNRWNIANQIWFLLVVHPTGLVDLQWRKSLSLFFRANCLPRPWNNLGWRPRKHCWRWITVPEPGLITRCNSFKAIWFRVL